MNVVNVGERNDSNVHEKTSSEINDLEASRERRERRERFSNPYACADARAPACVKEEDKRSRRSRRSPDPANPMVSGGERCGERLDQRSPIPNPPAWLDGVP